MKFRTQCVGWKAILRILSFPTSSYVISLCASSLFLLHSFPLLPISLQTSWFLCELYLFLSMPASYLPLCLELARRLLHTVMGMHTDVCMCVYRRSRQLTAGLKQKEYNLLREEESKEMREVYNDRGREEVRKVNWEKRKRDKAKEGWQRIKEVGDKIRKNRQMRRCEVEETCWEKKNTTQGYASQNERHV